jgi:hypothetical protein
MMETPALQNHVAERARSRADGEYSWKHVCERYDATISSHLKQ